MGAGARASTYARARLDPPRGCMGVMWARARLVESRAFGLVVGWVWSVGAVVCAVGYRMGGGAAGPAWCLPAVGWGGRVSHVCLGWRCVGLLACVRMCV